jgi:hypothetical protein
MIVGLSIVLRSASALDLLSTLSLRGHPVLLSLVWSSEELGEQVRDAHCGWPRVYAIGWLS